jgi:glycosyltransferase involved in cell wall biosynthesis
MYVPLMKGRPANDKYDVNCNNAQVIYSYDYSRYERIRYHYKRNNILWGLRNKINLDDTDLVHAHYLFSSGGVAYEIKQKRNIDYIVAIRNTDINTFFRYAIHLRKFGIEILNAAKKIIFVSPAHKNCLLDKYIPKDLEESIERKSLIFPNGIHDFWFDNKYSCKKTLKGKIYFIYVGEFTKNKNIMSIIKAIGKLRNKGYDSVIKLIGHGDQAGKIKDIANKNKAFIETSDWINSKEELLEEYRKADIFIMPSFTETFGLVYIEALSQGLPIIYTKGQGVDGYFNSGEVGYACNPSNVMDIVACAENIIQKYHEISPNCARSIDEFRWNVICRKYEGLYKGLNN